MIRRTLRILTALARALPFASGPAFAALAPTPLKEGVAGGVDEQIREVVTQVAKKDGLDVEAIVISGTASPNEALNNGDLNANSFQHIPHLRDQVKSRGYKIVAVGDVYFADRLLPEKVQVARSTACRRNDVDAAAIVNNVASEAGLYATRDGIAVERKEHNPYVNIIAARAQDRNAPWVPKLAKAYQSQEVRHFIQTHFNRSVIAAF